MHPWPKWSWTLCRFGWGLHKPIRHFDIPVSKLFRWVYDLFYAKNLIHWLILCTFLISASRRSCFGTALKYKFQVLVVSFLDARIGTISGVYQEAREPWECDSGWSERGGADENQKIAGNISRACWQLVITAARSSFYQLSWEGSLAFRYQMLSIENDWQVWQRNNVKGRKTWQGCQYQ